ncbi:MAG: hypothetical protein CMF74_00830 [Maricaulis sp.]|jgi:hypothetical protein|nr:hypothetical protein [Maricaulis sp.]HAQ35908.1 hypothetical protein [Alphaproteobacteria bacterium]|tara:strand:+ start:92 stop:544 length:453 start_codon:yes stop_codon:yes gene_type:complete
MRIPVVIRWLLVAGFCYPAMLLAWHLIFVDPVHPGGFRENVFIPFIILFPPIWCFIIVLALRERRVLGPVQYFTLSVMSLLFTQVLIVIWAAGTSASLSAIAAFTRGPPLLNWQVWLALAVGALGFLPMFYAAYVALERMPRPLGLSHSR